MSGKLRFALLVARRAAGRARRDRQGGRPDAGRLLRRPELPLGVGPARQPARPPSRRTPRSSTCSPTGRRSRRPSPASPLDGNDPAYALSDLDALVELGAEVRPPGAADDLGHAQVGERRADAEPSADQPHQPDPVRADARDPLQRQRTPGRAPSRASRSGTSPTCRQFLTPQFEGTKIVSPAIYAKLYMAAYKGIKAGNPNALVAAGETSNRGRNHPTRDRASDSVAPATFAHLLSQVAPKLPFDAWATHPYPTNFGSGRRRRLPTRTSPSRR